MKNRLLQASLLGLSLALSAAPLTAWAAGNGAQARAATRADHSAAHKVCLSPAAVKLQEDMRKLWTEHVTWTRNYIVSAVAGTADQQVILARLLQNQQDIGNAIKPYYGEAAGNKLAELLREHILLAGKIVEALKAGNTAEAEKQNKLWYRNADEMAKFLSKANPNWTEKELKDLLYVHLQLVAEAAATRLKQDWAGDVAAFDKGINHIIMLADALSSGIVKQFPQRF
ncbi:glycosyltransferase [Paenibacillus rhizovicinus]|uniref:Glycosyltransferase n=1 Tax=Paenibacillus rhizovicinus TaxID=2704463 RepID=A0A6C0P1L1_9BACL|nr:glycosyltransferase [Paenibacillus rhizovicinus]QHW32368.1 glycosyltransferase [Paenibacillus rhizovicinus]